MDADGNIIPIVEDDQGEGFKDPLEEYEKLVENVEEPALKEFLDDPTHKAKQRKAMVEGLSQQFKPQEKKDPDKMKMTKGMPIDFFGHRYKVLSVKKSRKGERVLLKYVREL